MDQIPADFLSEVLTFDALSVSVLFVVVLFASYIGFHYIFPNQSKKVKKHLSLLSAAIIFLYSGLLFTVFSASTLDTEAKVSTMFLGFLLFYPLFSLVHKRSRLKQTKAQDESI